MGIAKVTLDGVTQMDLSEVTVTSGTLITGATAHSAAGEALSGTLTASREDSILDGTISGGYINEDIDIIGQYALYACTNLMSVTLPNATTMWNYGIGGCTNLTTCDLGPVASIAANGFNGNTAMNRLTLRKSDSITTLANTSAFTNTPFASGNTGGVLCVPSSLISAYQAATNWSTILGYDNNSIIAIEEVE